MRSIRFEPEAREEFLAAIDWYEARDSELGPRFLAAVERALESIQYAPEAYPVALSEEHRSAARRKRLEGFPYAIVYLAFPQEIRILAVAHGRRRPGYWIDRAREH
jgi:toxin ParE1/3/4